MLRDTLDDCIGCGCLSIDRCKLRNPLDTLAKAGAGPRLRGLQRMIRKRNKVFPTGHRRPGTAIVDRDYNRVMAHADQALALQKGAGGAAGLGG